MSHTGGDHAPRRPCGDDRPCSSPLNATRGLGRRQAGLKFLRRHGPACSSGPSSLPDVLRQIPGCGQRRSVLQGTGRGRQARVCGTCDVVLVGKDISRHCKGRLRNIDKSICLALFAPTGKRSPRQAACPRIASGLFREGRCMSVVLPALSKEYVRRSVLPTCVAARIPPWLGRASFGAWRATVRLIKHLAAI